MTYLISDTHGKDITPPKDCDTLIHLGDYVSGNVTGSLTLFISVRGNHDIMIPEPDFVCDSIMIGEYYLTHQPVDRLPRGAAYNIHGHLHGQPYEDYGFEKKPFHIEILPNKLVSLEGIEHGRSYCENAQK